MPAKPTAHPRGRKYRHHGAFAFDSLVYNPGMKPVVGLISLKNPSKIPENGPLFSAADHAFGPKH